jgi:hypothetical protein
LLWATEQEGFPALVVHGPLVQQALLDYVRDRLGKEQQENGGVGRWAAFTRGRRHPLGATSR